MDLMELPENELTTYIDSHYDDNEQERREKDINNYVGKLKGAAKLLKDVLAEVSRIEKYMKTGEMQMAGKSCTRTIALLNNCLDDLNVIYFNCGYANKETTLPSEKAQVVFEEMEGNVLHIVFDTLLPKRIKREFRYTTNHYKLIQGKYRNAFIEYFKSHRYRVYDTKAVICFKHHFKTDSLVRDHDNFETKFVIDYIANYLLVDDSAKYCSHFHDYIVDGNDYSEIYVMPETVFWKQMYKKRDKEKGPA